MSGLLLDLVVVNLRTDSTITLVLKFKVHVFSFPLLFSYPDPQLRFPHVSLPAVATVESFLSPLTKKHSFVIWFSFPEPISNAKAQTGSFQHNNCPLKLPTYVKITLHPRTHEKKNDPFMGGGRMILLNE